ncbi:pantetheine-phosphate adenylyltransferase [Aequorivita echinoideorum]|uniref:Phosphopantetheine adenylyltransferase n=1 Tax=Aequorivita echinoideorum TaxID=1549647 RepID=A0ABS5S292_9FLAO|nr:pantetheine-phosphate adenylyltransferase [Aequorivita echinoideorum]MBT0607324.1 pantetheine-phosphate adenylyltransferase [Aequorivita echinoideorum]
MKRAVFPGTFDPITMGHVDIIERALPLFDELIIAIGVNADKKTMFTLEQRIKFIQNTFRNENRIKVKSYTGLTANFCILEKAQFIIRGLRNTTDLNYEQPIAQTNYKMASVETLFLICSPEVSNISSTIVRDIMRNDGNYISLVPSSVKK